MFRLLSKFYVFLCKSDYPFSARFCIGVVLFSLSACFFLFLYPVSDFFTVALAAACVFILFVLPIRFLIFFSLLALLSGVLLWLL